MVGNSYDLIWVRVEILQELVFYSLLVELFENIGFFLDFLK